MDQAKEYLQQGIAFLRAGKTDEAQKHFTAGLAVAPEDDALHIFCHGFRYFDAEAYIKRHPVMEHFEEEYLQLHTGADDRLEYFLRFFDGSVYEKKDGKDVLLRRSDSVPDPKRCDRCIEICGGLPKVSVFDWSIPGYLRSAEQAEFLFSRDTEKRFASEFYTTWHYNAEKRYVLMEGRIQLGDQVLPHVYKKHVSFPETTVCAYDVIDGRCSLTKRISVGLKGEHFPIGLQVTPNPAVAELIRKYYPKD